MARVSVSGRGRETEDMRGETRWERREEIREVGEREDRGEGTKKRELRVT